MEPVSLILTALAAGAGAGMTDTAKNAINDTYQGLKNLILRRFGENTQATAALAMFETNPDETIANYLQPHLVDHKVLSDPEVLSTAEKLLEMANKYSKGDVDAVQINGNVNQTADRGGVNQIGGNISSINTSFTDTPDKS